MGAAALNSILKQWFRELQSGAVKMQRRWKVAAVMGFLWAATLMYGEVFSFLLPVLTCPWPSLASVRHSMLASSLAFSFHT